MKSEKSLSKSLNSHYNFIKGRIAESLVERLFICLGMIPRHNGFEFTQPDLAHLRRTGQLPEKRLRSIEFGCDFVFSSTNKNSDGEFDVYPVEVKFSRTRNIELKKLKSYDNPELIFIFMDFKGFYCVTNQEILKIRESHKGSRLSFLKLDKLEDHKAFSFSHEEKEIIKSFDVFIQATLCKIDESRDFRSNLENYLKNEQSIKKLN